jgi:hypothetical protein
MSDNETDSDQKQKPALPLEPFEHICFCGKAGLFGFNVRLREGKEGQWCRREHRPR